MRETKPTMEEVIRKVKAGETIDDALGLRPKSPPPIAPVPKVSEPEDDPPSSLSIALVWLLFGLMVVAIIYGGQ